MSIEPNIVVEDPRTAEKALVLQKELTPIMISANAVVVADAATYDIAGQTCKELTALEKRIQKYWEEDIDRAYQSHRSLTRKRDEMLKPVSERKVLLKRQMGVWEDEQERVRRETQRVADEAARKMAEEQALAEAEAHERAGDSAAAAAVLEQPMQPPPVAVRSAVPKGYGTFTRKIWRAEIVDLMALVKAVAAGKAPLQALEANMVFLNNQARVMNDSFSCPGVKAVASRG